MNNHERLYEWWWSPDGPKLSHITVETLRYFAFSVANREENRVMFGNGGAMITLGGRDYAVLRFLILYCDFENGYRAQLEANSNPNGRYNVWRKDEFLDKKITINKNMNISS